MLLAVLLVCVVGASAQGLGQTDELEKYLLEALKSNETLDEIYDFSKEKPCEPYTPTKPDFSTGHGRVCEAKCKEYIWEMKNREDEIKWKDRCRIYLITQIKKGLIPEVFFIINSPDIFGGRGARRGEFPHMGAIGWRSKDKAQEWIYKCGSTLISDKFLLTAGHCTKLAKTNARDVINQIPEVVLLGLTNIKTNEFNINGDPVLKEIQRLIVHPLYAPPKKYHDIALIEMKTSVKFALNVQPACLWPHQNIRDLGRQALLTGWGYTENGVQSSLLQVAAVDVLYNRHCNKLLHHYQSRNWQGFAPNQICAGKLDGGVDTCQGDSGGPLQVKIPTDVEHSNMYMVLGVTSFGVKCGLKDHPGVYARVASYINWIETHVWPTTSNTTSNTASNTTSNTTLNTTSNTKSNTTSQ